MLSYITLNNKNIFKSDYLNDNVINLLDNTFELIPDFKFNLLSVSNEYIARPDLISLDAYGDTIYGDIICKINGISNPFELNEGMLLVIPSPDYIADFSIRNNQVTTNNENTNNIQSEETTPIAKNKNEKRKPNDAIVGDNRFKVNPTSGVIVY